MNSELLRRCDLLVKNYAAVRELFPWSDNKMLLAGSSFYAGLDRTADTEKLLECRRILMQNTRLFSAYRQNVKVPLICKMAVMEDPEKYFASIRALADSMDGLKWIDTEYRILAALTIYEHAQPENYPAAVRKTAELYRGMKANHHWLTSGEDVPFAALLAVSDMDTDALLTEMEACYGLLKQRFYDRNAAQSLSHVLSVGKAPAEEKCRKVIELWDLLNEKDHKYGTGYELAVLGTLCELELPADTLAGEIADADEYLKMQKGFHGLSMGAKERRMYAALMVLDTHAPTTDIGHVSLMGSMLSLVISMEICMIIMMTSVHVSASSSN